MYDKKKIHPELRSIAKKIPYNRAVIKCAGLFLPPLFHFTRIPKEVRSKKMTIEGYQGLKYQVHIFEPSSAKEKLPGLIYVHGGAFSYKASAYHKKLACIYAKKAGCRVFFPDYHLAPEYPYPAAYEDVLALYRYLMENAEESGIEKEKIGVAGDSAGAAIAAMISGRYECEGLKPPCMQMLIYPVADFSMQTDSMKKFSDTPLWNSKNNKRMLQYYCANLKEKEICDAFPMYDSLPRRIPNTYIETAEYDCLHDEGILYGKKLREAGADVRINETKGTVHGYDVAIRTKIANRHIRKRIRFLKKELHGI